MFRAKVKERQYDESEFKAENSNYESAKEHTQQIEVQFQEEERLGFMFPLSNQRAKQGPFGVPGAGGQCCSHGGDPEFGVSLDGGGGCRHCAGPPAIQSQGGGCRFTWMPGKSWWRPARTTKRPNTSVKGESNKFPLSYM